MTPFLWSDAGSANTAPMMKYSEIAGAIPIQDAERSRMTDIAIWENGKNVLTMADICGTCAFEGALPSAHFHQTENNTYTDYNRAFN